MNVRDAVAAFRTEVLVSLITYYGANPGRGQKDAADHLGYAHSVVSRSTRQLVELDVVIEESLPGPGTAKGYRVNETRRDELIDALTKQLRRT